MKMNALGFYSHPFLEPLASPRPQISQPRPLRYSELKARATLLDSTEPIVVSPGAPRDFPLQDTLGVLQDALYELTMKTVRECPQSAGFLALDPRVQGCINSHFGIVSPTLYAQSEASSLSSDSEEVELENGYGVAYPVASEQVYWPFSCSNGLDKMERDEDEAIYEYPSSPSAFVPVKHKWQPEDDLEMVDLGINPGMAWSPLLTSIPGKFTSNEEFDGDKGPAQVAGLGYASTLHAERAQIEKWWTPPHNLPPLPPYSESRLSTPSSFGSEEDVMVDDNFQSSATSAASYTTIDEDLIKAFKYCPTSTSSSPSQNYQAESIDITSSSLFSSGFSLEYGTQALPSRFESSYDPFQEDEQDTDDDLVPPYYFISHLIEDNVREPESTVHNGFGSIDIWKLSPNELLERGSCSHEQVKWLGAGDLLPTSYNFGRLVPSCWGVDNE